MRILSVLLLLAASGLHAQPRKDRHVVLISIDGLAAYALSDPQVPLPNLRRLALAGAVADSMEVVNPSVTWPNHTSMVTGVRPERHGMLYNGLPVRAEGRVTVEPWRPKTELVLAPTVYDKAHEAGLTTAEVDWVAILNAPTITWSFPEVPRGNEPVVKEMVAAGLVTDEEIQAFRKGNIIWRDEIWTRAGEHILRRHKPNLLLFHLLTTDSSQHRYGARSLAGNTALALADARVGRLLDALKQAGIDERTTVIVTSDHGFKTYAETLQPNAFLRSKGISDVWVVPEGGTGMVYITRPERKSELLPVLRRELGSMAGVQRVIGEDEFTKLGYPLPGKNDRMADLVLSARDGFAFGGNAEGPSSVRSPEGSTPGAHGYLNTDADMDGVLIISGAGVRSGVRLGRTRTIDIAPTVAHLLGLRLDGVDGKVLREALR
ncbi:MAG TPA: alkaline phosphatase family protein [Bryobacteraceae bacterium]|nr:alkaline phosphatase family protein [Bryobacteraceae bacterium]